MTSGAFLLAFSLLGWRPSGVLVFKAEGGINQQGNGTLNTQPILLRVESQTVIDIGSFGAKDEVSLPGRKEAGDSPKIDASLLIEIVEEGFGLLFATMSEGIGQLVAFEQFPAHDLLGKGALTQGAAKSQQQELGTLYIGDFARILVIFAS